MCTGEVSPGLSLDAPGTPHKMAAGLLIRTSAAGTDNRSI
jgi:hypothetical protein